MAETTKDRDWPEGDVLNYCGFCSKSFVGGKEHKACRACDDMLSAAYEAEVRRVEDDRVRKAVAGNPEPRLIAAAVRLHGTDIVLSVPVPGRHHTIINGYAEATGSKLNQRPWDQGFLTNTGEFIDRQQAATLVRKNGQSPGHKGKNLYSEDLW